jgi:chromosome segregation ATPase
MASDADSLVLAQLREIRATLAGHSVRFDRMEERFAQIDERFDQIDKHFDDFHDLVRLVQGLAMASQVKARELEARHNTAEAWQQRLDERFDQIERRLREVEDRSER